MEMKTDRIENNFFSMDRKKEHSRHLAQRRRNLENLEYENLSRVLPVHQAIRIIQKNMYIYSGKYFKVIDGFLFCLDEAATLLYASETISIGFGLSQNIEK
ncbi:hypothetical protein T06_3658 [Trichinella sp. T6]|nr:hypothetical protein T06_3658 [Trichinella sp. T6]